jgi:hypothetical protein
MSTLSEAGRQARVAEAKQDRTEEYGICTSSRLLKNSCCAPQPPSQAKAALHSAATYGTTEVVPFPKNRLDQSFPAACQGAEGQRPFSRLDRGRINSICLIYLRFIIQPINVPAVKPTANVVATVSTGCRWMR